MASYAILLTLGFCRLKMQIGTHPEMENGDEVALEGSDVDTRHAPWSTFKMPNLLIALETGAASSLDHKRALGQKPQARGALLAQGVAAGSYAAQRLQTLSGMVLPRRGRRCRFRPLRNVFFTLALRQ